MAGWELNPLLPVLVFGIIGVVFYVGGLTTPSWYVGEGTAAGLWFGCQGNNCSGYEKFEQNAALQYAVQALEMMGLAIVVGFLASLGAEVYRPSVNAAKIYYWTHAFFLAFGATLTLGGAGLFCGAVDCTRHGGDSLWLLTTGSGFLLMSLCTLIVLIAVAPAEPSPADPSPPTRKFVLVTSPSRTVQSTLPDPATQV